MNEQTKATYELGVLGTGRMGVRLAAMFARAGRTVVLASRDIDRARTIVSDLAIPGLSAGTYDDALDATTVLPAIFIRDGLLETLPEWHDRLSGKLLIDISNPFNDDYSDFVTPWNTSGAEEVQAALPGGRVVGAFKNVFWEVFDQPLYGSTLSDVLVTGDDEQAKEQFFELIDGTPFRYLDVGPLRHSRTVERLTFITSRAGQQLGAYPRMNWRLLTHDQA